MTTPNMSGRTDDTTRTDTDDHVDPSDLLGEDGTVDVGKVKQITNRRDHINPLMDATCKEIRRRLINEDTSAQALGNELEYAESAIRNHAHGRCSCSHDVPALTYESPGDGWVIADDREFVVRVSASNVRIYHSNPHKCWNLPEKDARRYVDREHVERRGLDKCRICDETRTQQEQSRSLRNKINAGEVDL